MNNNKKSFATRAKELVGKYKRAKFDKVEKAELEAALAQLAQEQEAYKQANGMSGEHAGQNAEQEGQMIPQYDDGGPMLSYLQQPEIQSLAFKNINSPDALKIGQDLTAKINSGVQKDVSSPFNAPEYGLANTQGILSSLAGGIGSVAGNLIMANRAKPTLLQANYTPEQISLADERARLARQAGTERNIAIQNLRTTGNRGAYLSGVGSVATGLNKNMADAMAQSYTKEQMVNMEQRAKAQDLNNQIRIANAQQQAQTDQDKMAYISSAIGAIPSTISDINNITSQNQMMELLGSKDYAILPADQKKRIGNALFGRQLKYKVKK